MGATTARLIFKNQSGGPPELANKSPNHRETAGELFGDPPARRNGPSNNPSRGDVRVSDFFPSGKSKSRAASVRILVRDRGNGKAFYPGHRRVLKFSGFQNKKRQSSEAIKARASGIAIVIAPGGRARFFENRENRRCREKNFRRARLTGLKKNTRGFAGLPSIGRGRCHVGRAKPLRVWQLIQFTTICSEKLNNSNLHGN
jgi:hypothetical protein